MLAWQLESRLTAEGLQQKLHAYTLVGSYTGNVTSSNDFEEGLVAHGQEVLDILGAQGLVARFDGRFRRFGKTPAEDSVVAQIAARLLSQAVDGVAASHHLGRIVPGCPIRGQQDRRRASHHALRVRR
jgi:light-regulated signal transduction histidine kinase (bacteriophytochrome)